MRRCVPLFALLALVSPCRADEADAVKRLEDLKAPVLFRDASKPGKPVTLVVLSGKTFGAAQAKLLGELKHLQRVSLIGCDLGDADMADVAKLPGVTDVTIGGEMKITAVGVEHLARMPKLDWFSFHEMKLTPAHLRPLGKAKSLTKLTLDFCKIGDEEMKEIGGIAGLTALSVSYGDNPVTDAGLAPLARLTKLETLTLMDTKLSGPGLKSLSRLTKLSYINLQGSQITDDGIVHLADLPALHELKLIDSRVTGTGFSALAKSKVERETKLNLNLNGSPIDDKGAAAIAKVPFVWSVGLNDSKITDAGLKLLCTSEGLYSVHVGNSNVTAAAIADLKKKYPKKQIGASEK